MLDAIKKAHRVADKFNKNQRDNQAAFERMAKKYGHITLPDGSKAVPINHLFAEDKEEYNKIVKLQKELLKDAEK
jgi:predicted RNA-binding protein (virulence factor B family)